METENKDQNINRREEESSPNNNSIPKYSPEENDDPENSELGADMYDYGLGGPGAGRDDSDAGSRGRNDEDRAATMTSDVDTGAGVGSTNNPEEINDLPER